MPAFENRNYVPLRIHTGGREVDLIVVIHRRAGATGRLWSRERVASPERWNEWEGMTKLLDTELEYVASERHAPCASRAHSRCRRIPQEQRNVQQLAAGRCPPQSRRMRIPAGQFTSFLRPVHHRGRYSARIVCIRSSLESRWRSLSQASRSPTRIPDLPHAISRTGDSPRNLQPPLRLHSPKGDEIAIGH